MDRQTIFSITEREVELQDDDALSLLINDLIWNRAFRIGLPLDRVRTTLRITEPDGGVDAITDLRERDEDPYLGRGLIVWQFKKAWPGPKKLTEELKKPGVRAAFADSGGYTLVLGKGVPPSGRNGVAAKLEVLNRLAQEAGCTGSVRLFSAGQVASWSSTDPAALFSLRPAIRNFTRADHELGEARHAVPFEPDDPRRAIIETISTAVFGPDPTTVHYRIQGLAGVGKTRLALEITRHAGLAQQTLYSYGVPDHELFNWVSSNELSQVYLIVDECEEDQVDRLQEMARRAAGRLRLITVGPGITGGEEVFRLAPLSTEAMERVVASAATLPREQVRWVAEKTRGYVKLAVLVAQAIAQGKRSTFELSSDLAIAELVKNLVVPSAEGRRALQGIALLNRVGFRDEVAHEARAIANFMGMDWSTMREALRPAQRQGIVVTRGRYWYVSPELLAVWLAGEVWHDRGDEILSFADALPDLASRMAFFERIAGLRDIPEVERVVADLLGPQGPFDGLGTLDSPQAGKVFSVLAKGHPQVALLALQRLIGSEELTELAAHRTARRELVWTLEHLAQYRETFFGAARLLRRLAEAENEEFANSATGIWSDLFSTILASTEVPAPDRLTLLDDAIADDSPAVRRLAVAALAIALGDDSGIVLAGNGNTVPPSFWRPQHWIEVREIKRTALARLATLIADPAPEIAKEARSTLRKRTRYLVEIGLTDDVLALLEAQGLGDGEERRRVWEAIQWVLKQERHPLSAEQRSRFEQLAAQMFGRSLSDRIRRYLGRGSLANRPDERSGEPPLEVVRTGLAAEALNAADELEALLPWLFSGEAYLLWDFAERMGELDADLTWLERLREAGVASEDPRLLSGYLSGRARAEGDRGRQWREGLLDAWAADRQYALAVVDATVRGEASDQAAARLLGLVDRSWIDAASLGWLRQNRWLRGLSSMMLEQALTRLVVEGSGPSIAAGLGLLAEVLEQETHPLTSGLVASAWQLIEHPAGWGHELEASEFWEIVARHLLDAEPLRVADAVLTLYRAGDPAVSDPRLGVLVLAAKHQPQEVWAAVGRDLAVPRRSLRLLWDLQEIDFVLSIPMEQLTEWISERGGDGAGIVARALKLPDNPVLPELARFLIRRYGDETMQSLLVNFWSGSWIGSETAYLQGKIDVASAWLNDPDPAVRSWADQVRRYFERRIDESRVREEEEALV